MDPLPVVDLHCDMLAYLSGGERAHPGNVEDIGCATPHLQEGNVKLQVMAIFSPTGRGSVVAAQRQVRSFERLSSDHGEFFWQPDDFESVLPSPRTGIVAALENASGLCEEDEPLDVGFARLEGVARETGRVLYISLTHNDENRFGGGNASQTGLKPDGEALLDYIDGRAIAVDLSHASTRLMREVLDFTAKRGRNVPVIASHSNFRSVFDHPRNLPDDVAEEIFRRKGLVGINFVRAFVHPRDPDSFLAHIEHSFKLGGEEALCFGADFFHWKAHPDPQFSPHYFPAYEHAGTYQDLLSSIDAALGADSAAALAYQNAMRFLASLRFFC